MPFSGGIVVEIVGGSYLDNTSSEGRINQIVIDDYGNSLFCGGVNDKFSVKFLVTAIFGVYSESRVTENCFWPCCGN